MVERHMVFWLYSRGVLRLKKGFDGGIAVLALIVRISPEGFSVQKFAKSEYFDRHGNAAKLQYLVYQHVML